MVKMVKAHKAFRVKPVTKQEKDVADSLNRNAGKFAKNLKKRI